MSLEDFMFYHCQMYAIITNAQNTEPGFSCLNPFDLHMEIFMFLAKYQLLVASISAWAITQITKAFIHYLDTKKFSFERLLGNGGMPSSHASTMLSLVTTCLLKYGAASFEFAMTFIFAIVVINDACGVRLETGKQAKLLNTIIEEGLMNFKNPDHYKHLKELIGHTPFQVLIGALMGTIIAIVINAIVIA